MCVGKLRQPMRGSSNFRRPRGCRASTSANASCAKARWIQCSNSHASKRDRMLPSLPHSERPSTRSHGQAALRSAWLKAIGSLNLVDVRSPDEFSGKLLAPAHLPQEQSQRGGHVPTARNIPWSKSANDDGTFRSDDELTALYGDAGVDLSKDTIAYCRIGERSAHTWFALHELLDLPNVKNYDGSWTEYGALVGVPIEKGA